MSSDRRFSQLLTVDEARQVIDLHPADEPACDPAFAIKRAGVLLGCYPRNQADDAKTYTAAVAAILADFSERVVHRVTDPRTGVARTVKFLPSIAEIATCCEREADRGSDVRKLAERHLKARTDVKYREALEDMLNYPVGRLGWSENPKMAARVAAILPRARRA